MQACSMKCRVMRNMKGIRKGRYGGIIIPPPMAPVLGVERTPLVATSQTAIPGMGVSHV